MMGTTYRFFLCSRRWLVGCAAVMLTTSSACQNAGLFPHARAGEPVSNAETNPPHHALAAAPATQPKKVSGAPAPAAGQLGQQLYSRHCAACHGADGNGEGLAAAYVFPKPRNLQAGRFRLVSTTNAVPTRDDLHAVLLRGMPGSSMPPWGHLSQVERDALVDEIMRLRALGARAQYIRVLVEDEELTEEEIAEEDIQQDIQEFVERFTTPGELTAVPQIGPSTPERLERAKAAYATFGCLQCHGEDGKGDGVRKMVDDEGYATAPRDFTAGIFKGSPDPESLYRRIAYGLPGTPMPSSQQMTPEQGVDLVHYVLAMSTKAQRDAAVLNRATVKVKRVSRLPADMNASSWRNVPSVSPRIMPLWWRNNADPSLTVQAVHDGKSIAVLLTWQDASHDDAATKTEAFEDAVAMQLYRGKEEPFLGMGGPGSPVDVWFWDADRQRASDVEDQYPRVVADIYPFHEKTVGTAEYQREGTKGESQPPVSLPARASGNPIVPEKGAKSGASSLSMGGPGSTTFRLPKSQIVNAKGEWKDGRWSVVMTRPLTVASTNDGLTLQPGTKASAAFAIWNGSAHDRDGMKLITIWQDMHLDP